MEDTLRRLGAALPEGLDQFARDLRRNVQATIGVVARHAELVTREEFDVQTAVLQRTRARLEALEARVAALEERLTSRDAGGRAPGATSSEAPAGA